MDKNFEVLIEEINHYKRIINKLEQEKGELKIYHEIHTCELRTQISELNLKILRLTSANHPVIQIHGWEDGRKSFEKGLEDFKSDSKQIVEIDNELDLKKKGLEYAFLKNIFHNISIVDIDYENNIKVERRNKDPESWIVSGYDNLILTKDLNWVIQPFKCDSAFIALTRFSQFNKAYEAALNAPHYT